MANPFETGFNRTLTAHKRKLRTALLAELRAAAPNREIARSFKAAYGETLVTSDNAGAITKFKTRGWRRDAETKALKRSMK